ncbi:MAG TPA: cobalamin B12-binding domain-containing protein [Fervidobacterium sp.]|nr:methylmalonyl-CoA mutase [Fervidobacterium sp.]HOK88187.1 cobalamin B12-binding domain-containing protein [Fervidobacterium sp.]HOM74623.1 cobalamin B12-binding domain-containing protein [Fervidobacterium sp.]HRD20149.1 cobalamin B12-binding domain-containing protein [Fervidobacterium sp.]
MGDRKIRVLIAKPGLDGHDRGAKVVARGLRDAGMEVIYTGLRQTPEEIVRTAMQEDVDMIGLSILSGAHMSVCKRVLELMSQYQFHVPVFVGGIIPADDGEQLMKMGIAAVFGPGTPISDIVNKVKEIVGQEISE